MIESPDTAGKFWDKISSGMNDASGTKVSYEDFVAKRKAKESIVLPSEIGETYWHIYQQPRSAWSFEIDIRPWTDKAWFQG